jgi:hypothetical protein
MTIEFNNEQKAALRHLDLADFDFEKAAAALDGSKLSEQDDEAWSRIEWSMLSEGREGDTLNGYGEVCRSILNAIADL